MSRPKLDTPMIVFCAVYLLITMSFLFVVIYTTVKNKTQTDISNRNFWFDLMQVILLLILFGLLFSMLVLEIKILSESDPYKKKKLQKQAASVRIASCTFFFCLTILAVAAVVWKQVFVIVEKDETENIALGIFFLLIILAFMWMITLGMQAKYQSESVPSKKEKLREQANLMMIVSFAYVGILMMIFMLVNLYGPKVFGKKDTSSRSNDSTDTEGDDERSNVSIYTEGEGDADDERSSDSTGTDTDDER